MRTLGGPNRQVKSSQVNQRPQRVGLAGRTGQPAASPRGDPGAGPACNSTERRQRTRPSGCQGNRPSTRSTPLAHRVLDLPGQHAPLRRPLPIRRGHHRVGAARSHRALGPWGRAASQSGHVQRDRGGPTRRELTASAWQRPPRPHSGARAGSASRGTPRHPRESRRHHARAHGPPTLFPAAPQTPRMAPQPMAPSGTPRTVRRTGHDAAGSRQRGSDAGPRQGRIPVPETEGRPPGLRGGSSVTRALLPLLPEQSADSEARTRSSSWRKTREHRLPQESTLAAPTACADEDPPASLSASGPREALRFAPSAEEEGALTKERAGLLPSPPARSERWLLAGATRGRRKPWLPWQQAAGAHAERPWHPGQRGPSSGTDPQSPMSNRCQRVWAGPAFLCTSSRPLGRKAGTTNAVAIAHHRGGRGRSQAADRLGTTKRP